MTTYKNEDPFADVATAQNFAREGVQGYGDSLQPQLRRTIGSAIGGLNAIGGLRSGGTVQALNDISSDYGSQIGAFAQQATLGAMNTGLGANAERRQNQMFRFQQDEARRARQGSVLRTIGGVLGAGIGFAVGGPKGALTGATQGGSLAGEGAGSGVNGGGSGYSEGDPFYNWGQ